MLLKKISSVPLIPVEKEGAHKVFNRIVFGPKDAAPNFSTRVFEFEPAGHTPYHYHPYEHQVLVLEGELAYVTETKEEIPLTPGDAVMVMPGEMHQFRNRSNTNKAKMVCVIPIEYQNNR
jgi:quercetin dioxygenase-like cupin family protein